MCILSKYLSILNDGKVYSFLSEDACVNPKGWQQTECHINSTYREAPRGSTLGRVAETSLTSVLERAEGK